MHTCAEHGYDGVLPGTLRSRSPRHLSFLTLQRGNAFRDALRHGCALRRLIKSGRAAWARWCVPDNAQRTTPLRYCSGVSPVQRLKARLRQSVSEKPSR
ncbi:hypothetical protein CCL12_27355 [Pseudomonas syringae]|nr:hypothetical protein CCL12_27355 [Pseudomonas syringae]